MEALSPFCRGQTPAVPSAARPVHWWAAVCFCCSAFCCRLLLCLERHKQCRSVWLYSSSRASLATLELLTYLLELPPPLTAALTIHTTMLMILSHFLLWHNSRSSANRSNYNRLQLLASELAHTLTAGRAGLLAHRIAVVVKHQRQERTLKRARTHGAGAPVYRTAVPEGADPLTVLYYSVSMRVCVRSCKARWLRWREVGSADASNDRWGCGGPSAKSLLDAAGDTVGVRRALRALSGWWRRRWRRAGLTHPRCFEGGKWWYTIFRFSRIRRCRRLRQQRSSFDERG